MAKGTAKIHQLTVHNLSIRVIQKKIKNIYFRVCPYEGTIQVTAPYWLSLKQVHVHIETKLHWLEQQQKKIACFQLAGSEKIPTTLYFWGQKYNVTWVQNTTPAITYEQENFCIHSPSLHSDSNVKLLDHWFRQQLILLAEPLLTKWQETIGVTVDHWSIRKMKSRWGSCQPKTKQITLNLRLVQRLPAFLEYVIVHELIHLLEPSHNQRFYQLMTHFFPNWKNCQKLDYFPQG